MHTTNRTLLEPETDVDLREADIFEFDETELDGEESLFAGESDVESLHEAEIDEYEVSASSVPKPGNYYAIQYGKGGLLTTTGRAYGVPANAERLKLAQAINQHPRNRKFWVPPSNAYEKRYFPSGIISFNPMFTCGPDQRRASKSDKRCFARIWIPPAGGKPPALDEHNKCGVPPKTGLGEIEQELEIEELERTAPKVTVRPRLCLFQNSSDTRHRNHFQCGALRQARRISAIKSPNAASCSRSVGATPYDTGGDIIRFIEAARTCAGNKAVDTVHIFSHGFSSGVPGTTFGSAGLYQDGYAADRADGGRTLSDLPTAPFSNNIIWVLHGCNIAAGTDNFAKSLFDRLAASLSNPKVFAHHSSGCAGANTRWREYSKSHPNGRNIRSVANLASGGCCGS